MSGIAFNAGQPNYYKRKFFFCESVFAFECCHIKNQTAKYTKLKGQETVNRKPHQNQKDFSSSSLALLGTGVEMTNKKSKEKLLYYK